MPTENAGPGLREAELRERAIDVLVRNHRDGYTVPAGGLYPFQWCWDSGPIALGWAAAGRWDDAWTELTRLMSAQWPSGMVPHIVFWHQDTSYFPGPEVWATGRTPPSSGITQPPLPVSAAARLFVGDPDRERAVTSLRSLWPGLMAWLSWIERARTGPHGANVIVHPWESGMDNSPSWDQPLSVVPEVSDDHIERRDVTTISADQRPSQREYRQYLGIVDACALPDGKRSGSRPTVRSRSKIRDLRPSPHELQPTWHRLPMLQAWTAENPCAWRNRCAPGSIHYGTTTLVGTDPTTPSVNVRLVRPPRPAWWPYGLAYPKHTLAA